MVLFTDFVPNYWGKIRPAKPRFTSRNYDSGASEIIRNDQLILYYPVTKLLRWQHNGFSVGTHLMDAWPLPTATPARPRWPVSGKIPLTYKPPPAIASSSRLDASLHRARIKSRVRNLRTQPASRTLSGTRRPHQRGIENGFVRQR